MGRKLIGGLAVFAVAAAAVAGGWTYVDRRVLSEVEARFAALRAEGAEAKHGAMAFDLFSRTLRVADISIIGKAGEFKAANVTVEGLDLTSPDLVARRVGVDGVEVKLTAAPNAAPDRQTRWQLPKIEASGVRVLATPRDLADARTPIQKWAAHLASLSATSMTIPALNLSMAAPPPQPASRFGRPAAPSGAAPRMEFAYTDVRIEGLADGAAKRASYGKTTITGVAAAVMGGSLDGASVADIDILPMFGLGLARRTPRDGIYPIQGAGTLGAMTMSLMDGGAVTVGKGSYGGAGIDPKKFSFDLIDRLNAVSEKFGATPPTPEEAKVLMEVVTELYESLTLNGFDVENVRIVGPRTAPTNLDFDRVVLGDFNRGRLSRFRVEGLRGSVPGPAGKPEPFKIGLFALEGFDFVRILKLTQTIAPGAKPPPEFVARMLQALEGFEIAGMAVPDPVSGQITEIDLMKAQWGAYVNDLPTRISYTVNGAVPIRPGDPNLAPLLQAGISKFQMKSTSSIEWVESESAAKAKGSISVNQIGSLDVDATFANLPRRAISLVPGQFASALPEIQPASFAMAVRDGGMVDFIAKTIAASQPAGGGPAPGAVIGDMLKMTLVDPAYANGNLAKTLDTFGQFLGRANQGFTVKLRPKLPMSLAELLTPGALAGPAAVSRMFENLDVEAKVVP